MALRIRDWLLLVAGVPGIVALFLPVTEFFGYVIPIKYYWQELLPPGGAPFFWGLEWMAALPVPVLLLQVRRLLTDRDVPRRSVLTLLVITLLLQLAAVTAALSALTEVGSALSLFRFSEAPPWAAALMVALSAGNGWVLYRNWRRGRSLTATTEMLMMGAYIVAQSFWLPAFLANPFIAPKLMAWTCLVYAANITLRLSDSRFTGGVP